MSYWESQSEFSSKQLLNIQSRTSGIPAFVLLKLCYLYLGTTLSPSEEAANYEREKKDWLIWVQAACIILATLGKDYYIRWTEHSAGFFLKTWPLGEGNKTPKLHTWGGFFGPWSFIILNNSHQDLSNEGSNFILSQLEVGHWVAETWQFFDKLPKITDFGLLQQSQKRARFWTCLIWPRTLTM